MYYDYTVVPVTAYAPGNLRAIEGYAGGPCEYAAVAAVCAAPEAV